jgi:hypothetical protein
MANNIPVWVIWHAAIVNGVHSQQFQVHPEADMADLVEKIAEELCPR